MSSFLCRLFRLFIVVAGVFAVAGCERPTPGSASYPFAHPAPQRVSDSEITAMVKARLAADAELLPIQISVETRQGVVILSGMVPLTQIRRVESIARNVNGVRAVDNQLRPTVSLLTGVVSGSRISA